MATGNSDIWDNTPAVEKVKAMSPMLQESFLRSLEKLYERESEMMLTFIDESRAALRLTAHEIREEQEALKHTSDILRTKSRIEDNDKKTVEAFLARRERDALMSPETYSHEVEEKLALERYLKKREKKKLKEEKKAEKKKKKKHKGSDVYAIEDPAFKEYKQETDAIMHNMRCASAKIESERNRQMELILQKKEKKKKKQEEQAYIANELIELATEHEKKKHKDKERQDKLVKEKLEFRKRERERTMDSLRGSDIFPEVIMTQEDEITTKDKKKKKKKDKDKDRDEEKGEKKKKKKHKDKDKDREAEIAM